MQFRKNTGERVSLISGKKPIILICPHGFQGDDKNTAIITEHIARKIDCYAVINRGWERAESVDPENDKADCNNIDHCYQEIVKEEFLDPIFRFVSRSLKKHPFIYTFYLHGMANLHRLKSGLYDLDIVVGSGGDDSESSSCSVWRKDLFCFCLYKKGFKIAEGTKKSKLAGASKDNMNQLFVQKVPNALIQSLQIEIIETRRRNEVQAIKTADLLSGAFNSMLETDSFYSTGKFDLY